MPVDQREPRPDWLEAQHADARGHLSLAVARLRETDDQISLAHVREALEVLGEKERYMIPISSLYEALERDYIINHRKTLRCIKCGWKNHLRAAFGQLPAAGLTSDRVTEYIAQRQAEGASNATINRETACLQRAFSLAIRAGKLTKCPHIQHLVERNVRSGYLRDSHFDALARETSRIGVWLRALFEIGAVYGWRKGELLGMRVRQVDFEACTIQLEAGTTKNDQPRLVQMTDDVMDLLKECVAGKGGDEYVFTRQARTGTIYREVGSRFWWISYWHEGRQIHRSTRTESQEEARSVLRDQMHNCLQRPVCDFRKDWKRACEGAGCPGLLFHDLRRSAVRRMINCGVRETTAMRITGHRTRSVFDRYAISNQADLDEAVEKLERKPAAGTKPPKALQREIR